MCIRDRVEVLARSGMEAGEISAIGITNQRETTTVSYTNLALAHQVFAFIVQRAGGLVQNEDGRVFQKYAGNGDALRCV